MKNAKSKTFIVFLIMIIVFYFILKDDYKKILQTLSSANPLFIIIAIIFLLVYYLLKAICLHIITREHKKDVKFKAMVNQTLITQFFNGITPFSTGGQPMQIYMLKKSGLSIGNATSIIIQDFLMYQLALVTMGIVALVLNNVFNFIKITPTIYALILLGFIINIVIGLCLLFISFSKRFNNFVGRLIIKIGSKVRIIKDRDKTIKAWETKLEEFHNSAKIFKKNKLLFIRCYSYNTLALIVFYAIPFIIFKSFDINCPLSVPAALTSSAFVLLVGNFVPIPGGSVGIEYSFIKIFDGLVKGSLISPALIIWRFITYYLGVVIGGIALGFFKGSEKK